MHEKLRNNKINKHCDEQNLYVLLKSNLAFQLKVLCISEKKTLKKVKFHYIVYNFKLGYFKLCTLYSVKYIIKNTIKIFMTAY